MTFQHFVCWQESEIDHFVRREAIEGERHNFLGVHLPISKFILVTGTLVETSEEKLYEALFNARHHSIVLVEGEPGSGKSHLIQWIRYRWPDNTKDHLVLVPRSDGSLFGTLDRLRIELGKPFSEPLEGLGRVDHLSDDARANNFLGQLVTTCQKGAFAKGIIPPKHADWLEKFDVWRILNQDILRETWQAPRDIVHLLTGAQGQRDQDIARFRPAHIIQLVELIRGSSSRINFGSFKAQQLFVKIQRELSKVDNIIKKSDDINDQCKEIKEQAPETHKLIEALDARCANAVQGLIGIQRDELQKRFLDVRRSLKKHNLRLVLLLEDITNLQGVDRQLIEALLPTPASPQHKDLCDLIAVVGLTPYYYQQFFEGLGNLRDRLKFHIRLTTLDESSVVARETQFLGTPQSRAGFVGTYFNAVRVGNQGFKRWIQSEEDIERPNNCTNCVNRESCFAAFGSIKIPNIQDGDVGLYPLTEHAIEKMWENLRDPEGKRSLKTPRGLLMNVISAILHNGTALINGLFPNKELESRNLQPPEPGVNVSDILEKANEKERQRLKRTIVLWGDSSDGKKRSISMGDNNIFYSGVPEGVMKAFGLAWPEEETETILEEETETILGEEADDIHIKPLPTDWEENIKNLDRWRSGKRLEKASVWEELLWQIVKPLKPEDLNIPAWLWESVITKNNVILEGTRDTTTSIQFEITRCSEVHRGLTATAWLMHGKNLNEKILYQYFTDFAAFQAWIANQTINHITKIKKYLWKIFNGDPVVIAIRELVAGTWLSSNVSPDDPLVDQWKKATIGDYDSQEKRNELWKKIIEMRHNHHNPLVDIICEFLRVGQAPVSNLREVIIDGSIAYQEICKITNDPHIWPKFEKISLQTPLKRLAPIMELAEIFHNSFDQAIRTEIKEIYHLAEEINNYTSNRDTEAFIRRVKNDLEKLVKIDKDLIPYESYNEWISALKGLENSGVTLGGKRIRNLDDIICKLLDENSDLSLRESIIRASKTPRSDITNVHETIKKADRAINQAFTKAKDLIDSRNSRGVDQLRKTADRIHSAAKAVKNEIERKDNENK